MNNTESNAMLIYTRVKKLILCNYRITVIFKAYASAMCLKN